MLDGLGWPPLSYLNETGASLILFYKIINGLALVHFEGVLLLLLFATTRSVKVSIVEIDSAIGPLVTSLVCGASDQMSHILW